MKKIREITLWITYLLIFSIGFLSLMVLVGDDDPANPMTTEHWLLVKGISLCIIIICVFIGRGLCRKGYIPESINKIMGDEGIWEA